MIQFLKVRMKNKQENGQYIEINKGNQSYTDFVLDWADENNIDLIHIAKFVPQAILDKIKSEALALNKVRPSIKEQLISPAFDI